MLYYINIIVIFNHVLLGILLFFTPQIRSIQNKLLALQMILFGITHLNTFFFYYPVKNFYEQLLGLDYAICACIGPIIYFYAFSCIHGSIPKGFKLYNHFLLAVIILFAYIGLHTFYYRDYFIVPIQQGTEFFNFIQYLGDGLISIQALTYVVAAFLLLFKAIKNKNNKKNASINWLKTYLRITAVFLVTTLPMGFIDNGRMVGVYIAAFSLVYFIILLWRSLVYSKYFTNEKLGVNEVASHPQVSVLMEIIAQRKLYTNKDISPDLVANELEINKQEVLSTFSNGLSFNDFISQLRVNDAKSKLLNPKYEHYTVEAIGKEAGFHSRSTFYDAFKKYTGQTPTQYRLEKKTLTN